MQGGRKGLLCCCCLPFSFSSPTFDISGKSRTTRKRGYTKVTTIARWEKGEGRLQGSSHKYQLGKAHFSKEIFQRFVKSGWVLVTFFF